MEQGIQLSDLAHLAPELTLVISAVIISLIDLMMPKKTSRTIIGWLTLAGLVVAAVFVALRLQEAPVELLNQTYRVDNFGNLIKLLLLGSTGLIVLMSVGWVKSKDIPHVGEYYYFYLPAVLGGMIMASSGDLITLFVGLELLSITSYIMVAMKKKDGKSNEGAFKYTVLGGISSAMILYGMSFLYGMSGSTNLGEINAQLSLYSGSFGALIYVAFFLLLAGFGFKIAAAPFHTWAPDVYQGAPTPVTAFLAVVSKAAGLALVFRVIYTVFFQLSASSSLPIEADVYLSLSVLAAISMIAGNFMALRQKNMKRLLAYSGIANAGYLLVPIATQFSLVHMNNFSEFIYYLVAYALMNIGAFALLLMIEATSGTTELKGLAGLYYRAPWTAVAMVLIVLSLAGIPISAGFFGKLFILLGALETQLYWLAAIMILTSVVSYYYYFGIIRQMFMRGGGEPEEVKATVPLRITLWTCAGVGVVLGFYPGLLLNYVESIFKLATDLFIY
ncbi:NADH-quinone oxidoreductase subunit N [Paenibacillus sp. J2TS4]|uniref:NADH-quinone oxidoreductase subunit N n=1 Tax=Paenibacillus sp. J2TS4 TaxID=2807194 RepID=UPI001B11194B|nr:NADH-quinone oxidoreductase subunit N [Paenibacillus sp. J2TS4]GIP35564.1 NADH-quinone oxidoreductase subunit N [Paenibacillus sp. J2TS4]